MPPKETPPVAAAAAAPAAAPGAAAPSSSSAPPVPTRAQVAATTDAHDLLCPITLDIMVDPVIGGDGVTYDRSAITKWIAQKKRDGKPLTSPLSAQPMDETLRPDPATVAKLK